MAGGLVRAARRPPGWIAPGPAPTGPRQRADLAPAAGEDLCHLAGDWRILQRIEGHRWSLDDLVTAWLAAECTGSHPPAHVVDLGSGIGAVLLLLAWRFPTARVTGIEVQAVSVALARRSIAWNGVADRCAVRLDDLRNVTADDPLVGADLVTGTPPYLRPGTATESRRVQWGPCHFTHRGGLADYCATAARLLASDGWFVACEAAGRGAEVEASADAAGLAVDRALDVVPREGKSPLFTVYAFRRGARVSLPAEPPLVVRDHAGRRTDAFRAVRAAMGMPP